MVQICGGEGRLGNYGESLCGKRGKRGAEISLNAKAVTAAKECGIRFNDVHKIVFGKF